MAGVTEQAREAAAELRDEVANYQVAQAQANNREHTPVVSFISLLIQMGKAIVQANLATFQLLASLVTIFEVFISALRFFLDKFVNILGVRDGMIRNIIVLTVQIILVLAVLGYVAWTIFIPIMGVAFSLPRKIMFFVQT